MGKWDLSPKDLYHIVNHGIDLETFNKYRLFFEKGKQPPRIIRPCTASDGIEVLSQHEQERFIRIYEEEMAKGRCSKFVPASGAATRMFQSLCHLFGREDINTIHELSLKVEQRPELKDALRLLTSLDKLPFYGELSNWCKERGFSIPDILERGPLKQLINGILTSEGLGLGTLPKALLPFYRYGSEVRTAFEEHIIEAIDYVMDREGVCKIHFTVSKAHLVRFNSHLESIIERLYKDGVRLDISFSIQDPSTDTPAVDERGELLRDSKGDIIFRPGGHGALLKNLEEYGGDIVFIKNVDNVTRDQIKPLVVRWKKIIGGMLIALERDFNNVIRQLRENPKTLPEAEMVYLKWKQYLPPLYEKASETERRAILLDLLDRPKRVCGMVKNVGEPGGGPFWVMDKDGWITRQIIEKAQIDTTRVEQMEIWRASIYFNPVDVVCSLRNPEGFTYRLSNFVDPSSYIITEKLHHGKPTRVLEHPGLWNGSMAYWITIFVEVPRETFHPVKKITDLIKNE
ncbi:MAG: DUF4301 family protein [Syntrophobacterales bacterium]|nr:DUF4301 family protein [Syntrophobacterales bacterium]